MVTITTRNKIKQLTWTNEGHLAFQLFKALVNVFLNSTLLITLCKSFCTLARSDYAHGAYLCQLRSVPNEGVNETYFS